MKLIYTLPIFLLLLCTTCGSADTFDSTGWGYHISYTISPTVNQTNAAIPIYVYNTTGTNSGNKLYLGNKINSSFADIRFVNNTNSELYNYWLETGYSDHVIAWVNMTSLTNGTPVTISVYYNNSTAQTLSNGTKTFQMYVDVNKSYWTIFSQSVGSSTFESHTDYFSHWSQDSNTALQQTASSFSKSYPIHYRAKIKLHNQTASYGTSFGLRQNTYTEKVEFRYFNGNWVVIANGSNNYVTSNINNDTNIYDINYTNTKVTYKVNDSEATGSPITSSIPTLHPLFLSISSTGTADYGLDVYWIWVSEPVLVQNETWENTTGNVTVANFTTNVSNGTPPISVQFTDSSTETPTSWSWNFDDGYTSTAKNPVHTFVGAGNYTVTLTATNAAGSNSTSKYINVSKGTPVITWANPENITSRIALSSTQLNAQASVAGTFVYDPVSGTTLSAGTHTLNTTFTPTDSTNYTTATKSVQINVISAWSWNFGDGYTSTEQNPAHTYTQPGSYTVILTIQNGTETDTRTRTEYISVNDSSCSFTSNVTSGNYPLTVRFNDTSTNKPTSWHWDFGDGNTSTDQNVTHTYYENGKYTVSLNATNQWFSKNLTKLDYINVANPIRTVITNFEADQTLIRERQNVSFIDQSTNSTSWHWSFGDGNTSTEQNPVYNYSTYGTYNVSLNASNGSESDTMNKTGYITVLKQLTSNFTSNTSSGKVPLPVQFSDASTGNITSWFWDFGDGYTSTEHNPIHTFTNSWDNEVQLIVYDELGYAVSSKYILVGPLANFTTNTSAYIGQNIQFSDTSLGTPTSWAWDFENESVIDSTEQSPIWIYNTTGSKTVNLTISNDYGTDSKLGTVNVTSGMNFTATQMSGNITLTTRFKDTSCYNSTAWKWDFNNDGIIDATTRNPIITFSKPGLYTVNLTVTNQYGNYSEVKPDYIVVNPFTISTLNQLYWWYHGYFGPY